MRRHMSRDLLDIEDLHVEYRRGGTLVRAVDGLDLRVERGRTLGLVGEIGRAHV